jgi:hypothetical protein
VTTRLTCGRATAASDTQVGIAAMKCCILLLGVAALSALAAASAQAATQTSATPSPSEMAEICRKASPDVLLDGFSDAIVQSADVPYFHGDGTTHVLAHSADGHAQVYNLALSSLNEHSSWGAISGEFGSRDRKTHLILIQCNAEVDYDVAGIAMFADRSPQSPPGYQWPDRGSFHIKYDIEYGDESNVRVINRNFTQGDWKTSFQDVYGEYLRRYAVNYMAPLSEKNKLALDRLARANAKLEQANRALEQANVAAAAAKRAKANELALRARRVRAISLGRPISCWQLVPQVKQILAKRTGYEIIEAGLKDGDKNEIAQDGKLSCTGYAVTERGTAPISFYTDETPQGQQIVYAIILTDFLSN